MKYNDSLSMYKKLALRKFIDMREERRDQMFSRRHYREIAEIIAAHTSKSGGVVHKRRLVEELSAFFKADNPMFDQSRFEGACNKSR